MKLIIYLEDFVSKFDVEFEKWWKEERGGFPINEDHISVTERQLFKWESEAWQAACEYKQKEYSNIIDAMTRTSQNNAKLQAENAKLRECVEFYADRFSWTESEHPTHEYYAGSIRNDDSLVEYTEACGDVFKDFCGGKRARQVLKELENK